MLFPRCMSVSFTHLAMWWRVDDFRWEMRIPNNRKNWRDRQNFLVQSNKNRWFFGHFSRNTHAFGLFFWFVWCSSSPSLSLSFGRLNCCCCCCFCYCYCCCLRVNVNVNVSLCVCVKFPLFFCVFQKRKPTLFSVVTGYLIVKQANAHQNDSICCCSVPNSTNPKSAPISIRVSSLYTLYFLQDEKIECRIHTAKKNENSFFTLAGLCPKKTVFRFPRFFSFSWIFFSFFKEIYNPITMFSLFEILFVVFSCSVRRTQFDVRLIEKKSTWLLAEDFYFACYFEYRCYNWREETENTAVPFGNKFFVFMHVTNTRAIFFFGQYAHLATTWYTLTHAQAYTV